MSSIISAPRPVAWTNRNTTSHINVERYARQSLPSSASQILKLQHLTGQPLLFLSISFWGQLLRPFHSMHNEFLSAFGIKHMLSDSKHLESPCGNFT